MLRTFRIALSALLLLPVAAAAQKPAATFVYQGASVRAKVPTLGAGWFVGTFAHARSTQGDCFGVGLKVPKLSDKPILVTLGGISVLQVDRRTNMDAFNIGLEAPADSDWQAVDLKALEESDKNCKTGQ